MEPWCPLGAGERGPSRFAKLVSGIAQPLAHATHAQGRSQADAQESPGADAA